MKVIPTGSTIGILGGGQLGRMLSMAAAQLGYRSHIVCPEANPPAGDVAADVTTCAYEDLDTIRRVWRDVAVITYEFENVPVSTAAALEDLAPLRPNARALEIAQDRVREKSFATELGGDAAPWADVASRADLATALHMIGTPAILKTRRMGYDGKGQARIAKSDEADEAWADVQAAPSILEGFVPFDREISVLIARGLDGATALYGPIENTHVGGILRSSCTPVPLSPVVEARAFDLARRLADALEYVGVLGVEMFVLGERVLLNEMAPRVHNSGHWTIEGAVTSQFENHIRAICGLPLGTSTTIGAVEMRNLIGDDAYGWHALLADPTAHVHLYGKAEVRAGRKMGHVTWVR
jgi:5-(carboxyamino)imidazole ribonucleotide synthase